MFDNSGRIPLVRHVAITVTIVAAATVLAILIPNITVRDAVSRRHRRTTHHWALGAQVIFGVVGASLGVIMYYVLPAAMNLRMQAPGVQHGRRWVVR